jgi:hypothetical protein
MALLQRSILPIRRPSTYRHRSFHRSVNRCFSGQADALNGKDRYTTVASEPTSQPAGVFLEGQVIDLAADIRTFRPGSKLDIPYELTVSESMQDFWQSVCWRNQRHLYEA